MQREKAALSIVTAMLALVQDGLPAYAQPQQPAGQPKYGQAKQIPAEQEFCESCAAITIKICKDKDGNWKLEKLEGGKGELKDMDADGNGTLALTEPVKQDVPLKKMMAKCESGSSSSSERK